MLRALGLNVSCDKTKIPPAGEVKRWTKELCQFGVGYGIREPWSRTFRTINQSQLVA